MSTVFATTGVPCASREGPLAEALERMAEVAPSDVRRATVALDSVLRDLRSSPARDVAWRFSRLTGDGFPVELGFSLDSPGLRFTCEVAGPEVADRERLDRAATVLEGLGAPLDGGALARIRGVQRDGHLRWGAWLGLRHGPDGDGFKLYAEVPRVTGSDVTLPWRRDLGWLPPDLPLRMIGLDPMDGRIELYYRVEELDAADLHGLLTASVGASGWEAAHGALDAMGAVGPGGRIRGVGGLSVAAAIGSATAITVLLFARSLLGHDANCRARLLRFAARQGGRPVEYERASAPLADRPSWRTCHGVVGVRVTSSAGVSIHVGLRPPPRSALASDADP